MTNLKSKPFALIGVNLLGHEPKKLKAVMDKENLTWRTFADVGALGHGAITARWNVSSTPTLYVIDHKGVIRHKWLGAPGAETIDSALAPLIRIAESGD